MRPKKRILLIDTNENRASIRRYLLSTNGFAVTSVASAPEARAQCADQAFDCVVMGWPSPPINEAALLGDLHLFDAYMPSLLIAENSALWPQGIVADAAMLKGHCSSLELLERAKAMCARKRGPRKKPVATVGAPELAEEVTA